MNRSRRIVDTRFGQVHARLAMPSATPAATAAAAPGPLVLLHLSPQSGLMWDAMQGRLDRTSIAPDRLGYGFSDAPPRGLSIGEYAQSTLDALAQLGFDGPFDVLGMHTGALEALELAHLAPGRVRRVGMVALPVFSAEERARGPATYAQPKPPPVEDGSHLLTAWRARFQFRVPPWNLADVQRRCLDYLLAPQPGQAYEGVFRYDAEDRLRTCPVPIVAFAPRDDVYPMTLRAKPLLRAHDVYVDLPSLGLDLFVGAADEMTALVARHLPGRE